jgi:hypothetical protein
VDVVNPALSVDENMQEQHSYTNANLELRGDVDAHGRNANKHEESAPQILDPVILFMIMIQVRDKQQTCTCDWRPLPARSFVSALRYSETAACVAITIGMNNVKKDLLYQQ